MSRAVDVIKALVTDVVGLRADLDDIQPVRDGRDGGPGPQGEAGPMGAAGPSGLTGADGPQGGAGPSGVAGPAGPAGQGGLSGRDGVDGALGGTGESGAQGEVGPRGPVGPTGPTGATGAPGAKGDRGQGVTSAKIQDGELILDIGGRPRNAGKIPMPMAPFTPGGGGGGGSMRGVFVDMLLVAVSSTPYEPAGPSTLIVDASAAPVIVDLSGRPEGERYEVKKIDATANTVSFGAAVIDGAVGFELSMQHETVTVRGDGSEWWIV